VKVKIKVLNKNMKILSQKNQKTQKLRRPTHQKVGAAAKKSKKSQTPKI